MFKAIWIITSQLLWHQDQLQLLVTKGMPLVLLLHYLHQLYQDQGLPISLAMAALPVESVQCFSRKKTVVVVTYCKHGRGLIKINGCPVDLVEPEILRYRLTNPTSSSTANASPTSTCASASRAVATPPRSTPSEALAVVGEPDGRVAVLGAGEEKVSVPVVVDVHDDDDV